MKQQCLVLIAAMVLMTSCSTANWYESMRLAGESECRKQSTPAAIDDCMARLNRKSYADYEKERARISK